MKGNRRFLLERVYQIINHTNTHTELCFFRLRSVQIITMSLLTVLKSEYVALIHAPQFAKRSRLLLDFYVMSRFGAWPNSLLQL